MLSWVACDAHTTNLVSDVGDAMVLSDVHVAAICDGIACACDNGLDDDADGLVDGFDPECTGASDNDERTFSTGTPAASADLCRGCFFGAQAQSADACRVHSECVFGRAPLSGAEFECAADCEVAAVCEETCRPSTPNGCDCFGCCTVELPDLPKVNVLLGDACSLDLIADELACPRCTPNDACRNPCGRCELCLGRSIADLPTDCGGKPKDLGYKCDDHGVVCGADQPCGAGFYCHLGCCLAQP